MHFNHHSNKKITSLTILIARRNISIGIPLNREVERGTEVERSESWPSVLIDCMPSDFWRKIFSGLRAPLKYIFTQVNTLKFICMDGLTRFRLSKQHTSNQGYKLCLEVQADHLFFTAPKVRDLRYMSA